MPNTAKSSLPANGARMRAAVFREFGGPEVLRLEEVAVPTVPPGHVLVEVLAAGTNRLEHYLREGSVTRDLRLPHVLGSDAAGRVAALGADVTGFREGDRVIPMPGFPLDPSDDGFVPTPAAPSYAINGIVAWGTYAQFLVVPARWLVQDTTGLAPEQVATLPMALVTAVRAIRTVGGVRAGDHVLVHAGASGTGSMNIQVAKALGARVAATVQGDAQAETARAAGADLVIDVLGKPQGDFVRAARVWTDGRGLDVVIDNLGGAVLQHSLDAVRTLGVVVAMGFVAGVEATFHVRNFFFSHKQIRGTLMGGTDDLAWGLEQVRTGGIRPVVDRVLPLADASEAHRLMATNATRGTVVLIP